MLLFSTITNAEGGSFDSFDVDINEEIRLEFEENERIRLEFEENERIRIAQQNIESSSDSSSNEISSIVSVKKGYDRNYRETIVYFGLMPIFTLFPGPNSPVLEPTVFIGIASFLEGLVRGQS